MEILPNEILSTIFKKLSSKDLLSIQHSSHQMASIVDACNHWDSIYKNMCPIVYKSTVPKYKNHLKYLVNRFHPLAYQNEFLWLQKCLDSFKDNKIRFSIINIMNKYLNNLDQPAKQDIISHLQPIEYIEQLISTSNEFIKEKSNHIIILKNIIDIIMKLMEIYNDSIKILKYCNWILSQYSNEIISKDVEVKEKITNIVYSAIKMSPEMIMTPTFNQRMTDLMLDRNEYFHIRVLEIIDRIISLKFEKYIQTDLIECILPRLNCDSIEILIEILKQVEQLSRFLNLVPILYKLGTVEILTQLLCETSNIILIRLIISTFINMMNCEKVIVNSLVENGIIPILLQLLKYYPSDLLIQYNTIKIYSMLTVSNKLQEAIIASGAIKYIQSASRRFPEHQDSINELYLFLSKKKDDLNL